MHEDGVINTYYSCVIDDYTWHSFIKRCVQNSHLPHLCHRGLGGHSNSLGSREHYRNRSCDYPRRDTTCWSLQKAMIISQLALQDAREVKLINNTTWSDIDCLKYLRTTDWSGVENRSVLHCVVKKLYEVNNWFFFSLYTYSKGSKTPVDSLLSHFKNFSVCHGCSASSKMHSVTDIQRHTSDLVISSLVRCTEPSHLSAPCVNRFI